ncbi:MAG: insulinase family protein [Puniceicoccales bacterium]|jgi:zinc protease|nr:insulinase family protein [Puniceicoccales bacterium]
MRKNFIQFTPYILGLVMFYGCVSPSKRSNDAGRMATEQTAANHPTMENRTTETSMAKKIAMERAGAEKVAEKFEIKNDPRITFGQLENGFRYALMKNAYPEKRIALALNFDVGSAMEEDHERGLAHFLEHMAFRGSKHFPGGEMIKRMQKLGVLEAHDFNAFTSFLNTCYLLNLPNADPETIDTAFYAFRDLCDGLDLLQSDVDQERGVVLSEKRDRRNVHEKLWEKESRWMLKGTIIPERFPIGKTKVLERASAADLRHFYEKWYSPEKMFFAAVGNIDVQKFEEKIIKTFRDLPPRKMPLAVDIGILEVQRRQFFYFSDPDLPTTAVGIAALFPDPFPVDNYAAQRHRVAVDWTTGILQERLKDKKMENPDLFSGSSFGYKQNYLKTQYSALEGEVLCEHKNWSPCLKLLEQEMRKICQYGVSEEELRRQKDLALNRAERDMLAAPTYPSDKLAQEIVDCYDKKKTCLSPEDYYGLIKVLRGDIAAEDCKKIFREIWQNLYISVETNQPIESALPSIEAIFSESEAVAVDPNGGEIVKPFAYEHFETPYREIIEKNVIEDLGITQLTLANGVTINLKPTDFEQNQIQFALTAGHGLLTDYPHPQPGIFLVADHVLLRSGLQKNPWKTLSKLLAAKCIQMDFGADGRCFYFSGTCDRKNLLCGLQLLAAYLSDAGFEERALTEVREALKPVYQNRAKSPSSVIADQYQKFITGNDFIGGLPEERSVFSVTMEDVKKLLLPVFQREAIELTIVGDFELDTAILGIRDTLGALAVRSPTNNTVLEAEILHFPSETAEKTFHFTGDEKRTLSVLTFPTDDENNIRDWRTLSMLAKTVDDRLYNKIRKEKGNVYSPHASNNPSPFKHFGLFEVVLSVDTEMVSGAKNETLAILDDLKTNPIPGEELDRVKLPILNVIRDEFKENGFWLKRVMHAHRRPQDLENLRTMRSFYENITPQDLLQAAQKYLHNPIHTTISRQPTLQNAEGIVQKDAIVQKDEKND